MLQLVYNTKIVLTSDDQTYKKKHNCNDHVTGLLPRKSL